MRMGPERNNLLFLLPQQVKERVFPQLREIELPLGQEIDAAGREVKFVYFPADCIISLVYTTLDGHSSEVSVVGHEGVVGISVFLGAGSTPTCALAQSAGTIYRMAAADFKRECKNDVNMHMLMLRYTQVLLTQIGQTAVCNRHHTVDQQVCRWLLLCLDRLPTNELFMTQGLIANMLGVRREGVTQAASRLQKLGMIRYTRGRIIVLDRPRLEALCCECYAVIKQETDRQGLGVINTRTKRKPRNTIVHIGQANYL